MMKKNFITLPAHADVLCVTDRLMVEWRNVLKNFYSQSNHGFRSSDVNDDRKEIGVRICESVTEFMIAVSSKRQSMMRMSKNGSRMRFKKGVRILLFLENTNAPT